MKTSLRQGIFGVLVTSVLLCSAFSWCANANSLAEKDTRPLVTIGLLDTFTPRFYIYTYTPLIEFLKKELPQFRFETREIALSEVNDEKALSQNDFLILSSGHYVSLGDKLGLVQVATRRHARHASASYSVGSVFVVAQDSPIQTLDDLAGKSVAASDPQSFEGWLIAQGEIAQAGYDPETFFKEKTFTENELPDVSMIVRLGLADVGILGTCELENAVADGTIEAGALRVINKKDEPPDQPEACVRSTALYPDVMFAALPKASADTVKLVTIALLTMPVNTKGYDWLSNNDTTGVSELLKVLKIGPWAYLRLDSLENVWRQYQKEILLGVALLVALLIHVVRVNRLVWLRTEELTQEAQARAAADLALKENRARLDLLERAGVVAQLSTMFAHEIKQPLTNIVNFLSGIRMIIEGGSTDPKKLGYALKSATQEAYRAADIVERVRAYGHREAQTYSRTDIGQIIKNAVRHAQMGRLAEIDLTLQLSDMPLYVMGDALELELVILNLLRNAADAVTPLKERATIALLVSCRDHVVCVTVTDNGPAISDERFGALGQITRSAKAQGMGFGLAIALGIAEAHGGHLEFSRVQPTGLSVSLVLPQMS